MEQQSRGLPGTTRSRRTLKTIGVMSIVVFVVVAGCMVFLRHKPTVSRTSAGNVLFSNGQAGVRLAYSKDLLPAKLSAQDSRDKIILRLTQAHSTQTPLQVTLRYETGLRPVATVTKQDLRDVLLANVRKSYPSRFPDFKELHQRLFTISSHDAAEIVFSYRGPSGDTVHQRFLIVISNDDTALYMSAQAEAAHFNELDQRYFSPLFTSLRL